MDDLNTFYGIDMILAFTPGIKCTFRPISHATVTAEAIAVVCKVDIDFDKNVEMFDINWIKTLPEISKKDNSSNIDILWKLSS